MNSNYYLSLYCTYKYLYAQILIAQNRIKFSSCTFDKKEGKDLRFKIKENVFFSENKIKS